MKDLQGTEGRVNGRNVKGVLLADKSDPGFDAKTFYEIFSDYNMENLSEMIEISPRIIDRRKLEEHSALLRDTELVFSTWGFGKLSEEEIGIYFPNLKAFFYAAGSVRKFAMPLFNCGVRVFSAREAHAVPVAEYTLAQILLANKGILRINNVYRQTGYEEARAYAKKYDGNYNSRVGILGAGKVGTKVIELLKPFCLDVLVFDPFLSKVRADELGAVKASLDMIFSTCSVISNHLANNEQTFHLINDDYLNQMKDYTTLINAGQGEQIDTDALVAVLRENNTITAVLDVTVPEPLSANHPLRNMDNVYLTPRIAGSFSNELARMGEYMCEECRAYLGGGPLKYEITEDMLDTIA